MSSRGCAGYRAHPAPSAQRRWALGHFSGPDPADQNKLVSAGVFRHTAPAMVRCFRPGLARLLQLLGAAVRRATLASLAPAGRPTCVARGSLAGLLRSREELRAEKASLRHQLLIASRSSKKPQLRTRDRFLRLAIAHRFSRWRDTLVLMKPDTLLRWHRQGFRLLWQRRSRKNSPSPLGLPAAGRGVGAGGVLRAHGRLDQVGARGGRGREAIPSERADHAGVGRQA